MESNGKSVNEAGELINYATAPVIWGQSGIHGQHAFYQMLHQGRLLVPMDFVIANDQAFSLPQHQRKLVANLLGHSSVLAAGKDVQTIMQQQGISKQQAQHRLLQGSKPASVIVLDELSPEALGQLLVLYEHKVFVQSVIWQINAFDQWGVEEGKTMAGLLSAGSLSSVDFAAKDKTAETLIVKLHANNDSLK